MAPVVLMTYPFIVDVINLIGINMLICIPDLLSKDDVKRFRALMEEADWVDGSVTAGSQANSIKNNLQLPVDGELSISLGQEILSAISKNNLFVSAALPLRILPPMFNSYGEGQFFGTHVDNAIRSNPLSGERIRTDLSCTVFLSEPDEYDGGELVIEEYYGVQEVKLSAGSAVLYPSTSLHQVTPITRGRRVSSFFWMQSMVREDINRTLLFDLDQTIQELAKEKGVDDEICVRLTGIYHNIIRNWVDT